MKSTATGKPAELVRFPIALAAVILAALIVLSGAGILLWLGLGSPTIGTSARPAATTSAGHTPAPAGQLTTQDQLNMVQIALIVTGGLGGVVALVVAYRKQRIAEDAHRWADEANQRETTKLFNERFTAASAQLGHESAAVRLAGAYAVAGLADDWEAGRQTCIDVLCAYLRMPYQPDPDATTAPAWKEGEREVRWSIISIIRDHLQDHADNPEQQVLTWQYHNLDFTAATFDGGDFNRAHFLGVAVFVSSRFIGGTVSFANTKFSSGRADFSNAKFMGGTVNFPNAEFSSWTDFSDAEFSGGTVNFSNTKFSSGRADFSNAKFSGGEVNFPNAEISGGSVGFSEAELSGGSINFPNAELNDGWVSFARAELKSGLVSFPNAKFNGGKVDFTNAKFNGGKVDFANAKFNGGKVDFANAEFDSGEIGFANAEFNGGEVNLSPRVGRDRVPPEYDV